MLVVLCFLDECRECGQLLIERLAGDDSVDVLGEECGRGHGSTRSSRPATMQTEQMTRHAVQG
ncbi:hypothetical protein FJ951_26885 [Mesorhizobium sp. B2-2-3]|nr:hypothetical protein FJ951_26885 [Mesorhizobium sp. B2-2-3]